MQNSDKGSDRVDNLWLARALWDLGAVTFGSFNLGHGAISSPVFVNPKLLISHPTALRVAAKLMSQEIEMAQSLRHPKVQPFDVVAGVPVGGLLLATALSLETNVPLVYPRPQPQGTGPRGVEGRFEPGARALLVDDLASGGTGIIQTTRFLAEYDLVVRDAVVLVDRGQTYPEALKQQGINLISILRLDVMMNHYHGTGLIDDEQYHRYADYVQRVQAAHAQAQASNPADWADEAKPELPE